MGDGSMSPSATTTTLTLISTLTPRERRAAASAIDARDLMELRFARSPLASWLVRRHGIPVGLFDVGPSSASSTDLLAMLYLAKAAYGLGISEDFYLASAAAAAAEGIVLSAYLIPALERQANETRQSTLDRLVDPTLTAAIRAGLHNMAAAQTGA